MEKNIIIRSIIIIYTGWWINNRYIEGGEKGWEIIIIITLGYYILNIIIERKNRRVEWMIEIIIIIGIISMSRIDELIRMYISIELISVGLYTLLYKRDEKENQNNIIYYFIINSLSSFLILFSLLLLYSQYGTLNISSIPILDNSSLLPLYLAIMVKLGIGPFYYWKVIIYSKLHSMRLLLISILPNFLYLYIFNHFLGNKYLNMIEIMVIISIIIGSLGYFSTNQFNRIIIYSSVYNLGLSLYNLYLSYYLTIDYNPYLYIIIYSINLIGFFLLVLLFSKSNISITLPHLFFLAFFLFSFIGFPPLAGFFIKFYLVYYSLILSLPSSFLFSLLILLSSILIAPLYLSLLSYYYFLPSSPLPSLQSSLFPLSTVLFKGEGRLKGERESPLLNSLHASIEYSSEGVKIEDDYNDSIPSSISLSFLFLFSFYPLSPYLSI